MDITATFDLKFSYFDRLCSSVVNLSKNGNIIKRLKPLGEGFHPYPMTTAITQGCSGSDDHDQLEALRAAVSSPAEGPPFLISGPFGSGKTRILALVSRFFFHHHNHAFLCVLSSMYLLILSLNATMISLKRKTKLCKSYG